MPKYLVTGGAGFIGSHLAEFLLKQGAETAVLDDLSTGREENLEALRQYPRFSFHRADLNAPADLERAMDGAEVVFHQAALGSVARSVDNPRLTNRSNVDGSLAVFECARKLGVRRVVMAGSSSVYGDAEELPMRESHMPRPVSPYAASKAAMEFYARAYTACFGLETVVLRYFNVFGPRQNPRSQYAAVVAAFASACLAGEAPEIHGDGTQSRDFVYVGDVVRANFLAAQAQGISHGVYNVGGGGAGASVNELFSTISRLAGAAGMKARRGPARAGDVRRTQADIALAAVDLGWKPQISIEEGLARTVDWFRQTAAAKR